MKTHEEINEVLKALHHCVKSRQTDREMQRIYAGMDLAIRWLLELPLNGVPVEDDTIDLIVAHYHEALKQGVPHGSKGKGHEPGSHPGVPSGETRPGG